MRRKELAYKNLALGVEPALAEMYFRVFERAD
jgi:hypothetical protein